MKYIIKVFLVFIILVGSLLTNTQNNTHAEENDEHWKKIKESGVLRVGLSADYAPMEFEKNINGKTEYAGVDIELAKKIAKDNHLKLKIINMQFDSLLGALKTGKIDIIISGMTTTPEREKELNFSKPYMMTNNIMLVKKKEKSHLKDINDFKNKRIAVQKGTDQEKIAKTEIENADVTSLNKLPETILSVKSNKADGAILEKPVAEAYIKQNPELAFSDVTFNEEKKPTCIALPKNSPILLKKLNQTIDEVNDKHLIDQYMTQASKDMQDDGNFYTKYKSFFIKGIKNTILI
ncbi:transporter substrate-binding domain-containing protein, partial [Bacillus sp. JR_15]